MPLLSAPSLNNRFVTLVAFATFLLSVIWFLVPHESVAQGLDNGTQQLYKIPGLSDGTPGLAPASPQQPVPEPANEPAPTKHVKPHKLSVSKYPPKRQHPIDGLIQKADADFQSLLAAELKTLHDAAEAYRARRGRQPPPAFNVWYAFAQNSSAVIIEEFFDQIYEDLNPFWGMPAKRIREQASEFPHLIRIRNGNATWKSEIQDRQPLHWWTDMVRTLQEFLPDVDLPINVMDESRIVVPWENVNWYMQAGAKSRKIVPAGELKTRYKTLRELDAHYHKHFDPVFSGEPPYWTMAVRGCPPDSPARKAQIQTEFQSPPPLTSEHPRGSEQGYVKNYTLARSFCENPELQGLHGSFVEPLSISTSGKLFALFSGSKLPTNNDILLPSATYWGTDALSSGDKALEGSWAKKENSLLWRGAATGGRNRRENWTRFQRHRFVSMVNATNVKAAERSGQQPLNFVLPSIDAYGLTAHSKSGGMGEWVSTWSDAQVVDLVCFPKPMFGDDHLCDYTNEHFAVGPSISMEEELENRYLPDIDGNSFSGRFRDFLASTSLPIKATIYQEWHDSRIVPWKHFVPMHNTFLDIYGIMEYFVGNDKRKLGGHDASAEKIAMDGKKWAERVLRREDMQIYVLRLLLEYARLIDDDRDIMGWNENAAEAAELR
nr:beta-1,2-xylosyltransferase 1 [Quercus suber]